MPKLGNLNLDKIKGPEMVPPGKYLCRLMDVEAMTSRSGKDMWKWSWEIAQGEFASRSLVSFTLVGPNDNLISLKQHLEAFGFRGDIGGVDTDSLIGSHAFLITVKGTMKDQNGGPDRETVNVQSVQEYKKPKPAASAPIADDDEDEDEAPKAPAAKARPVPQDDDDDEEQTGEEPQPKPKSKGKAAPAPAPEAEDEDDELPVL